MKNIWIIYTTTGHTSLLNILIIFFLNSFVINQINEFFSQICNSNNTLVVEQFAVGFWMNTLFQLCKTQLFEDFGENVDDEDKWK